SFRMQGVEFDNGDMYVDGHKAASDVRDEFVSVTEKLMDELAQCYNVLPQLDINNTIDHRPEGDEKWFLENEKTVTQFCRKLAELWDENAHNDKSVHGVLNPTYQAGLRRDAVQPDIEAERKKRDEIEAGKSYCSRRFGGATCDDK